MKIHLEIWPREGGMKCPYCREDKATEATDLNIDYGVCLLRWVCLQCDREWSRIYKFTGTHVESVTVRNYGDGHTE